MTFLFTLVAVFILVLLGSKIIKKTAVILYFLAFVLCVVYLYYRFNSPYNAIAQTILVFLQRGFLAIALFTIVMYIGAFKESSFLYKKLFPIRAELSILACILILGHAIGYLIPYFESLMAGAALRPSVLASLSISILLLMLVVLLGSTSLVAIKRRMSTSTWQKLQKTSYLFYALVYFHLLFMLIPSISNGVVVSIVSAVIYSVVFGVYLVLRLRKAFQKKSEIEKKTLLAT